MVIAGNNVVDVSAFVPAAPAVLLAGLTAAACALNDDLPE
jgi:hypothetical protein